ncbi:N-acetyltransferase [Azonexus sp. R2A61]|uniref:GNAT family N-acetyltransferase n=1 Tax=Azonexus sp. R2A61 TaxID=2744443 RepID=UPI001F1FFE8F|nr:GNAT family N-acetyltransferase [Azonexus sp. R2A61]
MTVVDVDLGDARHAAALVELLDHYAQDPMGGGVPLRPEVRATLVDALKQVPHFHGALAFDGENAVGLIHCFAGFSTFAARPLLNIHDIAVHRAWRGRGIGQALLAWAEQRANALGCCKLTLEVLSNNRPAMATYERAGFAPYVLDPAAGQALFLQKML